MGAVLLQDNQPVAYASKALTKTQQNNAQIEKKTLAIVYDCTCFYEYIYGICHRWRLKQIIQMEFCSKVKE